MIALAEIETGKIRAHTTELSPSSSRCGWTTRDFVEPGTIAAYRNDVAYRIIPTLGTSACVTSPHPDRDCVTQMQQMKPKRGSANQTYSAKTINNTLTSSAVILGTAVADRLLRENPCLRHGGAGSTPLRVRQRYQEMRYLMPDEIPVFLAACDPVITPISPPCSRWPDFASPKHSPSNCASRHHAASSTSCGRS